jgi:hypothetical protein
MADQDAVKSSSTGSDAKPADRQGPEPAPDEGDRERSGREERDREPRQRSETDEPRQERKEERAAFPDPHRVQQYGRPYFAERATGIRQEGAVYGGESYGFVQTLNRIVVPSAGRGPVAVGPVEPRLLEKVCSVLIPPDGADRARQILQDHRVLVLQGRAHLGKASFALWLLRQADQGEDGRWQRHDEETPPSDDVYAIAPGHRLDDLPERFFADPSRASGRYVVDTLTAEAAASIRLPVLRALSEQLGGGGSLVVTVDSRIPIPRTELSDYLVLCGDPPDATAVLRSNLRWHLGGQEPPDHLVQIPWVRNELRRRPLPGHLDQLAQVLAGLLQGDVDETEAEAAYARFGQVRVEEWFESHPGLTERCLMVAAAVLNGASYHEVADAAGTLQRLLEPREDDDRPPQPPAWGLRSPRRQLVEDVGGRVVSTQRATVLGSTPSEVLELEDVDLQREVLEHVWWEHEAIRSTLLEWLAGLGHRDNLDISGRAAAAVGALCRKDLVYLHNRLLIDWATSPELVARISAAIALDVVAGDRQLAKQVRALLHRWIRSDPGAPQAWTATAAYGFEVGRRWPGFALRDLRLVVEEAPRHAWIAGRTLANLCGSGSAAKVLEAIASWVAPDDPPEAAEQALRVFLGMLRAGADADPLAVGSGVGADAVPTLLRLAAESEPERTRLVELWKAAFNRAETQQEAVDALGYWITLADEQEATGAALDAVAPDLLMGSPREQDELAEILRDLANDPRRMSATARRYLLSIGQEISL